MDKDFSISGYLLSRLQPDDPREARLRMLCVTISKDMSEERRERQLRPFASDMEFMNTIAGWMNMARMFNKLDILDLQLR